jgi:hypothetical protein
MAVRDFANANSAPLQRAGNAAAATEQGIGYQAGLSLASGMTFNYLAVRHMVEAAS